MDREGFRNRMKQYKKAREENPGLKYWEFLRNNIDKNGNVVSTKESPLYTLEHRKELKRREHANEIIKTVKSRQQKFDQERDATDLSGAIPFLPEKAVTLTNAGKDTGVTLSTNVLDSIAKYANIADLSLLSALGLAGQESTFGKGYGVEAKEILPSILVSDWNYNNGPSGLTDRSENPYVGLRQAANLKVNGYHGDYILDDNNLLEFVYDQKYIDALEGGIPFADKEAKRLRTDVPVLEHAFKKYKSGKYNPNDPRHTQTVEDRGKALINSPEIQKWMKESEFVPKYEDGTGNVKNNLTWWEKLKAISSTGTMNLGWLFSGFGSRHKPIFSQTNVAQDSYLVNRELQQKMFENKGYTKTNNDDYGLVRKAVNNRNIPVFQKTKDAKKREDLTVLGNIHDAWYGTQETKLDNAAHHPTALYADSDGWLYQKGWDLNDYGEASSGNSVYKYGWKQIFANAIDKIGSPTVVTTGFQPVVRSVLYPEEHLNAFNIKKQKTYADEDDMGLPYGLLEYLDEMLSKKGLRRIDLGDSYTYGLPEVEVKPKKYKDGGEVQPDTIDPVDMYNKTRYQVNGIPINNKSLDNVFSLWDIPLGTAYKVWPAVNSFLKNYGPTLGAMVVGSTGKTSNKKSSPITTKQIDPTLKEYHEDIVIPLRPQDKYTKLVYLNNPDNFTYNMYADDILPNNRLADYNPRTGEIRIKESVANSELSPQIQGHESGHRIDQIMPRTDEVKQKIDEALQVGPRPLSKESRLLVEKEGEIDRLGYNLFKYMKDNNLMQIKEPTAKTKAFQEFITNATDELIAQMLGDVTAYTKDYKRGKIDYNQIRWILQNAPMIVPGLVIQQDLLTDKT